MRTATFASLVFMAAALSGCSSGGMAPSSGQGIAFVASNSDSVLLDLSARPPGDLTAARDAAAEQCRIFNRNTAVLESLNTRSEGTIRATYLCRGGGPVMAMSRRQ
jgi:hypothetical protein